MKISARKEDPEYHPAFSQCRAWLAGSERKHVISADEEGRMAVIHKLDGNGRFIIKAGDLETEVFRGDVRIECPDWLREECERPKYDYSGDALDYFGAGKISFPAGSGWADGGSVGGILFSSDCPRLIQPME